MNRFKGHTHTPAQPWSLRDMWRWVCDVSFLLSTYQASHPGPNYKSGRHKKSGGEQGRTEMWKLWLNQACVTLLLHTQTVFYICWLIRRWCYTGYVWQQKTRFLGWLMRCDYPSVLHSYREWMFFSGDLHRQNTYTRAHISWADISLWSSLPAFWKHTRWPESTNGVLLPYEGVAPAVWEAQNYVPSEQQLQQSRAGACSRTPGGRRGDQVCAEVWTENAAKKESNASDGRGLLHLRVRKSEGDKTSTVSEREATFQCQDEGVIFTSMLTFSSWRLLKMSMQEKVHSYKVNFY